MDAYTQKVDVYSFGIVLWEIWTGRLPYEGYSPVQIMEGVKKGLRPTEAPYRTHRASSTP